MTGSGFVRSQGSGQASIDLECQLRTLYWYYSTTSSAFTTRSLTPDS